MFTDAVKPLVEACLKGYNATVVAYGQTGSGKTFTILGPSAESMLAEEITNQDGSSKGSNGAGSQAGVIPRALRDLFNRLETTRKKYQLMSNVDLVKKDANKPYEYEVRVQFLELYGEEIRDLLSNSSTKLVIRDGGGGVEPEVIGASEVTVTSAEEALLCLTRGTLRRVTGATAMNSESSRSHAIMTVIVEQTTVVRPGSDASVGSEGSGGVKMSSSGAEIENKRSKFHFVDLAGSERQKRSLAQGQRLKEGIDINKGLLVLGNVISALGDPKKRGNSFVPYRDSKLTRLLKGSLGGNHKTLMIACVSPSSINMEESLNCLRYANRAKNIQNNAVINIDAGSQLVAELRTQVKALAGELLIVQNGDDSGRAFKMDVLQVLASGGDSSNMNLASGFDFQRQQRSNENTNGSGSGSGSGSGNSKSSSGNDDIVAFKAEIAKLKSVTKQLKGDAVTKSEELFSAMAESEYYRLRGGGVEGEAEAEADGEGKTAFVNRVTEYEREIANLKKQLRSSRAQSAQSAFHPAPARTDVDGGIMRGPPRTDDGPQTPVRVSHRARGKTFKPIVITNEEEKEEHAVMNKRTNKYLRLGQKKGIQVDSEAEDDDDDDAGGDDDSDEDEDETFISRQSILDSHVIQLSKGIAAKEELIEKLERSQLKYEVSSVHANPSVTNYNWTII